MECAVTISVPSSPRNTHTRSEASSIAYQHPLSVKHIAEVERCAASVFSAPQLGDCL